MFSSHERRMVEVNNRLESFNPQRRAMVLTRSEINGTYAIQFPDGTTAGNVTNQSGFVRWTRGDWVEILKMGGSYAIMGVCDRQASRAPTLEDTP